MVIKYVCIVLFFCWCCCFLFCFIISEVRDFLVKKFMYCNKGEIEL